MLRKDLKEQMELPQLPSWPTLIGLAVSSSIVIFFAAEKLSAVQRANADRKVQEKLAKLQGALPSVAIIGGGLGALAAVRRCQELGLRYKIYEKRADFGGTWLQNSYPGCGCDIAAYMYSFSWCMDWAWSSSYVSRGEILAYIKHVANNVLKINPIDVSFNTRVDRAVFSKNSGVWTIEATNVQTGTKLVEKHQFVITATGQLSTPLIPTALAKSMDRFEGLQFHSSQWPNELDLRGKRVVSIGTGCSAAQYLPEIAPQCKELFVLQRSPGYVIAKESYAYSRFAKWVFQHIPPVRRLYRLFLVGFQDLLFHIGINSTPDKQSFTNWLFGRMLIKDMKKMAPKALWDQLIPDFQVMSKRIVVSSDYLPMFRRENVKLVPQEVKEITKNGIVCADGTVIDNIDVIIYGTGFRAQEFLLGIEVEVVETNRKLHKDVWSKIPFAYMGATIPGIPNFAMLYGPNTNTGHSSVVTFEEAGADHAFALISECVLRDKKMFEVSSEACDTYNRTLQERLRKTVWNGPAHNWYRADDGTIVNNYPGSAWEFWSKAKPQAKAYMFS